VAAALQYDEIVHSRFFEFDAYAQARETCADDDLFVLSIIHGSENNERGQKSVND
jgi:hypothetical protein